MCTHGMCVHNFKAQSEVRQLSPVKKWPIYLKMQIPAVPLLAKYKHVYMFPLRDKLTNLCAASHYRLLISLINQVNKN